jgi:broad specificity phosphatase PhoE
VTRPARVLLIRHAPTAATRRHAFPADEPLDERAREQAAGLRGRVAADRLVSSPAARCRQTAAALAPDDITVETSSRWAELDFGAWAGRTMQQVWADDQESLSPWLEDPTCAPTTGEPLRALAERVAVALDELREPAVTTAVVTSAGPIKIAVLHALGAPLSGVWKLDVAPCSVTTLHARPDGGWTVRSVNVIEPAAVRA